MEVRDNGCVLTVQCVADVDWKGALEHPSRDSDVNHGNCN